MFVVLGTNPDTSGGSAYYFYVRSFDKKSDALEYSRLREISEKVQDGSWASHYEVFERITGR